MPKERKNFWYRLFVINTLDHLGQLKPILSGLIISSFGVLISLFAGLVFLYAGMPLSTTIAELSLFAYAALWLFHYAEFEEHHPERGARGRLGFILAVLSSVYVYVNLLDAALRVHFLSKGLLLAVGRPWLFLQGLPGLIVLAAPLFLWESLSKITPVDNIIKARFGK